MKEVIHFESQEARMAFLKGGYEEIVCEKVPEKKKRKTTKRKPSKKKEVKDEVPAE